MKITPFLPVWLSIALLTSPLLADISEWDATVSRAEQGDPHAQFVLGQAYLRGTGVAQSDALARQWFDKAAAQGDAEAESALGFLYAQGRGVPKDLGLARKWLRLAADQGLDSAQHNLGVLLLQEPGSSVSEGMTLLEKAGSKGYVASQYKLGQIYFSGDYGIARNYPKSFDWFLKAATGGSAAAQNNLGAMYRSGLGIERNLPEAFKWFQQAAEKGNAAAQGNLGHFYAAGSVVPRDIVAAYKWFKLGSLGGDVGAANQLAEITRALSSAQIKEAEALVRNSQEKARP